jgi:hypothetical protein
LQSAHFESLRNTACVPGFGYNLNYMAIRRDVQPDAGESRGAVAATVAWMLTCMSTAMAMLVVLGLRLLMIGLPAAAGQPHPMERTAGVLLFVAMMTGGLCLLLTPVAYRVRNVAPPRAITAGAVLIAISPIVLLIVLSLM